MLYYCNAVADISQSIQSYFLLLILMLLYRSLNNYSVELRSDCYRAIPQEEGNLKLCTAAVGKCWTLLNARYTSALSC